MANPKFSSHIILFVLPPQESHSNHIYSWAFLLMLMFGVGQSTNLKDASCKMQCNNAVPIYASR